MLITFKLFQKWSSELNDSQFCDRTHDCFETWNELGIWKKNSYNMDRENKR